MARPNKDKKISFADEHGKNIADVRLHFGILYNLSSLAHNQTTLSFTYRTCIAISCTIPRQIIIPRKCKKDAVLLANTSGLSCGGSVLYCTLLYAAVN
jgi:hypothetical protein